MKIKDLFKKEKEIIITIPVGTKYHIYIEGLDEFGGASISNIKDIKTLCVELHETSIDMLCGMNDYGINLNTDIDEIKIIAMKLIDKYEEKGEII